MTFIKKISQISKNDVALVGGKGASLGEMTKAKIPVPPGFIVTAGAFEYFLEENNLHTEIKAQLEKVNYDDTNSVDGTSNVIRNIINDTPIPEKIAKEILADFNNLKTDLVAVRSSATAEDSKIASWAGELESYLNTNSKNLLENVKKCWSSLFTPRAIFYRHHQNLLNTKVSVAVVVQAMVQSEISGICFTVHPVTEDPNQMIIEAGWGLGEAIVGGLITPDSYVVDKRDFAIIDIFNSRQEKMIVRSFPVIPDRKRSVPGRESSKILDSVSGLHPVRNDNITVPVPKSKRNKQKLSGYEIIKLAHLAKKIEDHYQHPQDIEWAFVKTQAKSHQQAEFYIVQSRPITTL